MKKKIPTATKRLTPPRGGFSGTHLGADYSEEQLEFLRAVQAYKSKHQRPHPTLCEILAIAVALGYRKCTTVA
jgi:hypothetical protein